MCICSLSSWGHSLTQCLSAECLCKVKNLFQSPNMTGIALGALCSAPGLNLWFPERLACTWPWSSWSTSAYRLLRLTSPGITLRPWVLPLLSVSTRLSIHFPFTSRPGFQVTSLGTPSSTWLLRSQPYCYWRVSLIICLTNSRHCVSLPAHRRAFGSMSLGTQTGL